MSPVAPNPSLPPLESTYLGNLLPEEPLLQQSIVQITQKYKEHITDQLTKSLKFQSHLLFSFNKLIKNVKIVNYQLSESNSIKDNQTNLKSDVAKLNEDIDSALNQLNNILDKIEGNFTKYPLLKDFKQRNEGMDSEGEESFEHINNFAIEDGQVEHQSMEELQDFASTNVAHLQTGKDTTTMSIDGSAETDEDALEDDLGVNGDLLHDVSCDDGSIDQNTEDKKEAVPTTIPIGQTKTAMKSEYNDNENPETEIMNEEPLHESTEDNFNRSTKQQGEEDDELKNICGKQDCTKDQENKNSEYKSVDGVSETELLDLRDNQHDEESNTVDDYPDEENRPKEASQTGSLEAKSRQKEAIELKDYGSAQIMSLLASSNIRNESTEKQEDKPLDEEETVSHEHETTENELTNLENNTIELKSMKEADKVNQPEEIEWRTSTSSSVISTSLDISNLEHIPHPDNNQTPIKDPLNHYSSSSGSLAFNKSSPTSPLKFLRGFNGGGSLRASAMVVATTSNATATVSSTTSGTAIGSTKEEINNGRFLKELD